jgi:cell division protein FtsZ
MTSITDIRELKARIVVLGVGGAGGNAVNNMIASGLQGVEFIVANTDSQALAMSRATRIIQMGAQETQALVPARSQKWGARQPKKQQMRSAII